MPLTAQIILAATSILLALNLFQGDYGMFTKGVKAAPGESGITDAGFDGRLERTRVNTGNNLLMFLPGMLIALFLGIENSLVHIGGMGFVGARVFYAIAYLAGVPRLRTVTWVAGVASMLAVWAGLFG